MIMTEPIDVYKGDVSKVYPASFGTGLPHNAAQLP